MRAALLQPGFGSSQQLSALERHHHGDGEADRAGFNDREGDGIIGPVGESEDRNHNERRDAEDPDKRHIRVIDLTPLTTSKREPRLPSSHP